ncbi:MAG: hypothetical protein AAGA99_00725 [Actinomycetota bacterium]
MPGGDEGYSRNSPLKQAWILLSPLLIFAAIVAGIALLASAFLNAL